MKLYYAPGACSLAAHIALTESGTDFEAIPVDLKKHETEDGKDFYAITARGYVPVLMTDDYGMITENPAVLMYLADSFEGPPARETRYAILEWVGFTGTEIHAAFHPLFAGDDDQEGAKQTVAKKFALAATLLGEKDWLAGGTPSVADNYLFVTTLWAGKFDVDLPQPIADFRDRNLRRPSVKQTMAAEGLG